MTQLPAADNFAMIRARMIELRRERERAEAAESELQSDPPVRPARLDIGRNERSNCAGTGLTI